MRANLLATSGAILGFPAMGALSMSGRGSTGYLLASGVFLIVAYFLLCVILGFVMLVVLWLCRILAKLCNWHSGGSPESLIAGIASSWFVLAGLLIGLDLLVLAVNGPSPLGRARASISSRFDATYLGIVLAALGIFGYAALCLCGFRWLRNANMPQDESSRLI